MYRSTKNTPRMQSEPQRPGEVRAGMRTPWGTAQSATRFAPGMGVVSTAGHGGVKLDRKRNAGVPKPLRQSGGWYEEDAAAAIAILTYPDEWLELSRHWGGERTREEILASATRTVKNNWPDEYAAAFGETVPVEESYALRARAFAEEHANDYVATAAWGDWHEEVPEDLVGVFARLGGDRTDSNGRYFLVPKDEYEARGPFGFVVDPSRHQVWPTEMSAKTKQVA